MARRPAGAVLAGALGRQRSRGGRQNGLETLSLRVAETHRPHPPGRHHGYQTFGAGLALLICGDIIRPDIAWLLRTYSPTHSLAAEMARVRDPDGFTTLHALTQKIGSGKGTCRGAVVRTAYILAAKGGSVRDITVGDCLELVEVSADEYENYGRDGRGPYFYTLLHAMGVFPPEAPPTVRMFSPIYQRGLTRASSPRASSSTATTWPAVPSATCSSTTWPNARPGSTSTLWRP